MLSLGFIQCLALLTNQLPLLWLHESVGYDDSYILDSIEKFRSTGILYPTWGPGHWVPTLYSPLVYWTQAIALAAIPAINPYIGPRILEFLWFLTALATAELFYFVRGS